jgi:Uma2 family endonuclease
MALPQPVKRYTPQEYYVLERAAEYKSDYYQGEIFNMSGGTANHSLISMNVGREVGNLLKGKPCRAYESNLRLAILATGLRCYPDVSVYCGPLEFDPEDKSAETATNPTLVFEVLSKSTEGYDRGTKAENYRQIPSLRAYVLVSQRGPHVEIYERQTSGAWLLRDADGLDAALTLPAIGVDLPLSEIYAGVEFPPPEPTPTVTREL